MNQSRRSSTDWGNRAGTMSALAPIRAISARVEDDEMVEDAVGTGARRDAAHGVRQVLVEPWEEAEAVLGRQIGPAVSARFGRRHAAGLAAGDAAVLEDGDVETPLGELVGGGHPRHAATEDQHLRHDWLLGRGPPARSPVGRLCPCVRRRQ